MVHRDEFVLIECSETKMTTSFDQILVWDDTLKNIILM